MSAPSTLVDLLRRRAEERADALLYRFLEQGEREAAALTYGELDRLARALGAAVEGLGGAGERAVLLYPHDLRFVAAFFGCLYAGATAVPVAPPRRGRPDRTLERFRSIVVDARPRIALSTAEDAPRLRAMLADLPGAGEIRWLATDEVDCGLAGEWRAPAIDAGSLAFLQYTSGSTAAPKGVMVTHGNVLHNEAMIRRAFGQDERSVVVGWLPFYHDMGLIGNVIQPLYAGAQAVLMSPLAFLQRPLRWPRAVSDYRGTTSGGPSFAYDLAVRRTTPEQRAELDLGSWAVAFNGAEPVRDRVMTEFAAAFAVAGFRGEEVFRPCYGLAEGTLLVSAGSLSGRPRRERLDAAALERHRVTPAAGGAAAGRAFVSCGRVAPELRVAVVDTETLRACPADRVGEIWISGPSVAAGYWNRPEETAGAFGARLADGGDGPFFRTGDLGFLADGELFVTGRIKDLVIVRGKNHYPQDLEWTVEASHPWLRRASCAAVAIEAGDEERLAVLAEVDPRHERAALAPGAAAAVVESVRRAVADGHGLEVHAVALVKAGELPKTTSGKLERHAARAGFLAGTLALLETSVLETEEGDWAPEELDREALAGLDPAERRVRLESAIRDRVAAALRVPRSRVDLERPLDALGLDSLAATELGHRLETDLGVAPAGMPFLQGLSVAEIAAWAAAESVAAAGPDRRRRDPAGEGRLSHGQEAIWFLQGLAPESPHYNIAAAARIGTELDADAFARALDRLVERHACLRTTFTAPHGRPVQRVAERAACALRVIDAAGWTAEFLADQVAAEASQPFDLERGPLFRVTLLRRGAAENVAVLAVHHLVADFWSLTVLTDELGRAYAAEAAGAAPVLEPLPLDYADFVDWQAEMLAGPEGERQWRYWRERLGSPPPQLDLPADRPRPARQEYRGAALSTRLGRERTRALEALATARGTTVFSVLLAAFQALLHRYTGQDDVAVGSPLSGRTRAALAGLVGYFVNPVVLRADLSDDPTFDDLLAAGRAAVLGALEHQDFPFALLVERLQPVRDPARSPLFQVMFILQKVHQAALGALAPFALGEAGERLELPGLALESMALEKRTAPFDLTLAMAEAGDGLRASFEYDTALFDRESIARLAAHFLGLLDSALARPAGRVSELALMREGERRCLLAEWNDTRVGPPREATVHRRLEAQARRTPDAVAVVHQGRAWSFRELDRRANRLARHLRGLGVGRGALVGVFMERSPELLVALLAALKAGAAYLPLDPAYPRWRTDYMLADSAASTVLTQARLAPSLPPSSARVVRVDADWPEIAREDPSAPATGTGADDLAYVIYTSGSTGAPKGVMVRHGSVVNFFAGMDRAVGAGGDDSLLAVTSISFDISVLELLWTLGCGTRVVVASERAARETAAPGARRARAKQLGFSLFYFANADPGPAGDKYRLLLEGARFADRHGFEAVWTPERHFHAFGGLYPSPAVAGAAVAAVTERVGVRAGSVVMPLHDPIRVAEDWSVVDNLSRGRAGVSFASGWHVNDFALAPGRYAERKEALYGGIETVKRLWRGESIRVPNGAGEEIEVGVHPRPIQAELPVWITAAGNPETFVKAGEVGAHVLTHLLGQSLEEVAEKVALYRQSRERHGHDPRTGRVTLMLHTFVAASLEEAREKVRAPLTAYLRTSVGLISSLVRGLDPGFDPERMAAADMDGLLAFAFDRYVETSGLFGSPESCLDLVERARSADVDELACLIDFGVDADSVLAGLRHLDALRRRASDSVAAGGDSLPELAASHRPSLFQCTPSLMKMVALEPAGLAAFGSLRALLLGGEAVPAPLVAALRQGLPARLVDVYGPTETTIWSTTAELDAGEPRVPIGRPIADTAVHVVDRRLRQVPVRVAGELLIGGAGLARGYLRRPALTAERFVPDPFAGAPGARLYRTGDLGHRLPDGRLECLGRIDQQVKVRGFRVELGEIEAVLGSHPAVREAAVAAPADPGGDRRLVAYVVARGEGAPAESELRELLAARLPDFMVPAVFVALPALPRTPNGKLDREALPAPGGDGPRVTYVAPEGDLEQAIAEIWRQVLGVDRVGIHDNFFDLGGHSLLMAQVQSQLRRRLQKDLPLVAMLEHPTVAALTRHLGQPEAGRRPARREADRAGLQRAGLWRQSQSVLGSRRPPTRRETA